MGLDLSFAPVGIAGGVLIRGISTCKITNGNDNNQESSSSLRKYIDGPCNCVRELLRACGASSIKDLIDKPTFKLDALANDGILHLIEHAPKVIHTVSIKKRTNMVEQEMRWVA